MGLSNSSTGKNVIEKDYKDIKNENGFTIALAGNPNVRQVYYF